MLYWWMVGNGFEYKARECLALKVSMRMLLLPTKLWKYVLKAVFILLRLNSKFEDDLLILCHFPLALFYSLLNWLWLKYDWMIGFTVLVHKKSWKESLQMVLLFCLHCMVPTLYTKLSSVNRDRWSIEIGKI